LANKLEYLFKAYLGIDHLFVEEGQRRMVIFRDILFHRWKNPRKFGFSPSRQGRTRTNSDFPLPAVEEPTQIWILLFPLWKSPHKFGFSSSRRGRARTILDFPLPAVEEPTQIWILFFPLWSLNNVYYNDLSYLARMTNPMLISRH
jgi:hypothetical protein